ncbi:MAG: transposase [Gammaproteobacteria bacterium]|nr:transposase [Gammaproteobacteria bacterium]
MPRIARVVVPHYPHHVIQRGNRRQQVFFSPADYRAYIQLMSEFCEAAGTAVWAYCLMPNHVHFVMVPQHEDGLRAAIGEAHRRYTRRVNFREGWRGHLWQERFHSFPMDEEYLVAVVRYVERNPKVAGLRRQPADWPWSSARAHIDGIDDELVTVAPMLERIDDWPTYLSTEGDDALVEKHSRTGRPLGSQVFVEKLESLTGRSLAPRKRGRKVRDET